MSHVTSKHIIFSLLVFSLVFFVAIKLAYKYVHFKFKLKSDLLAYFLYSQKYNFSLLKNFRGTWRMKTLQTNFGEKIQNENALVQNQTDLVDISS